MIFIKLMVKQKPKLRWEGEESRLRREESKGRV